MILNALVKRYEYLHEQGILYSPGMCRAKVSYGIDLKTDGKIRRGVVLKEEVPRGKKTVLVPRMIEVPELAGRGNAIKPNFLCDNAKYILGIDADGADERSVDCFSAARNRHLDILKGVDNEAANAVKAFFRNWDPSRAAEEESVSEVFEDLVSGGNIVFLFNKKFVHDDPEIREAWKEAYSQELDPVYGTCLVTGERTVISRCHKKISGVPGAQSSGASLVAFNAGSFCSYEKEQGYNAPVGKYADYAYTSALNYMLSDKEHTAMIGDAVLMYWAENGMEGYQDVFSEALGAKDNTEEIKGIWDAWEKGKYVGADGVELDPEQPFYLLAIGPNAARLSVRFFYRDSFGKILEKIAEHNKRIYLTPPAGLENKRIGIRDMLFETVNKNGKDKAAVPNMSAMTMKAVLTDSRYPETLFSNIMLRIRAEKGNVNYVRACVIKAYLMKNREWKKGEQFMELNEQCMDIPYVLGRMFAVVENMQRSAIPGLNVTLKDRYYNSACATPGMIFPILLKMKNNYERKLKRDKPGLGISREAILEDLMGRIPAFPAQLSLQEQGLFHLGYYQQKNELYKSNKEKDTEEE